MPDRERECTSFIDRSFLIALTFDSINVGLHQRPPNARQNNGTTNRTSRKVYCLHIDVFLIFKLLFKMR